MATQTRGGRVAILRAAITLFTSVGYHGASIRDIAREADVTVPAIYYHFDSKQAILQEIMLQILSEVIAQTRASLALADDPEEQLEAIVRTWVRFHIDRQAEAAIGASEIRSLDADGLEKVVALRDELEQLFVGVVERGVQQGRFRTPHPREAARGIINMGRSVANWFKVGGPMGPEQMAQCYADLSLALVEPRRPSH